ncbi:XrtA/PEP-CTERM system exopolysaccharide export protein [Catenovulum maritimum]|uniref:Sugar ABC transporter substrate-binding protein n=1 Tax=Catenovulum maritimum TaxID=1513271 RepID=A0A0J8GVF4_9ALTE|nr:XrtA/PEP-CTERM system exopolysaccharide export protein [Catenovulum maritimum]KMT64653.1 sugar ABC transporter substrate-binding protein [Catenovulum maritimum]
MNNKILKLFVVSSILFINACSNNYLPTATLYASKTSDISQYNYLIGPGDSLNIFVWRNAEISGTFTVRPDGKITTSLVEDIPVSGKTPTQLARNIEQILSTYIKDPIVTVSVGGFVGPYSEQVRIIGQASEPKAINYREQMTLLDLMVEVGGLTEFADGDSAKLIRIVAGEQVTYDLRISQLINQGDIKANVDLLPGDIIIVPEAWF